MTNTKSGPAKTALAPEPNCEFCDKRGLPVLLARFAVATADGKAPNNPAIGGSGAIQTLGDGTHYTMRLLRSGYLYVFDEARKRWDGYFITPQAYLLKFSVDSPMPASLAQGREPCGRTGHRELAGLVTIPDARHATKVWFGFSDVEWSAATLAKHSEPSYRRRHMQEMDVTAWIAGIAADPLRPIAQVAALVSEYVEAVDPAGFKFSPFVWSSRGGAAQGLISKADSCLKGKGAILVLNDPAGLAQELAALMKTRTDQFANVPERQWRLATSAAIEQIRAAIRNQAELAEISAAESLANDAAANAGLGIFVESTRKSIEDLRTVTPAALRRAADHAWQKYTAKYNEPARLSWQNTFNSELKSFDSRYIAPLAEAHAGWVKSRQMADYFDCNFDSNDAERGLVYVTLLTQCVAGTQDKGACAALYDHWLSANDPSDHGNLLLRAMTLNLDVVADKVAEAAKASVDPRILQWDSLLAVRDKAIERVKTEANDIYARFIAEFGGPIARALGRWADGTPGMRAAVMATGLISGHPIVLCELVGGKKNFQSGADPEIDRSKWSSAFPTRNAARGLC